jgi:beta-lactamase superfamily II metal-dependent hydrolase
VPIRWLVGGDRVGPSRVLNPGSDRPVGDRVANNDSLVLLLELDTNAALLTGDLESHLPEAPSHVTVLKVPTTAVETPDSGYRPT